jgi:hypothetical protein
MAVTVAQFQEYVGTSESGDFVNGCLTSAQQLVKSFVGAAQVPTAVLDQAVLTTASELFHRRNAPFGASQFADGSGQAVRAARDPMTSTYPLLQRFVGIGL